LAPDFNRELTMLPQIRMWILGEGFAKGRRRGVKAKGVDKKRGGEWVVDTLECLGVIVLTVTKHKS